MTETDAVIPVRVESPVPIPVTVVSPTPLPVAVAPDKRVQRQSEDPSLPAQTTFQEDLTFAGQRRVNLIWEYTQAIIALLVVVATMICGGYSMFVPTITIGIGPNATQIPTQIPTIIGVAFGMVTGFYFSRTNHAAIGGVGTKPNEKYEGR